MKLVWISALFCTFKGKLSPVDSNNSDVKAQQIYKYTWRRLQVCIVDSKSLPAMYIHWKFDRLLSFAVSKSEKAGIYTTPSHLGYCPSLWIFTIKFDWKSCHFLFCSTLPKCNITDFIFAQLKISHVIQQSTE